MDNPVALEIERARAERKSSLVLWVLNLPWPGLGNLVIGQTIAGLLFGFGTWFFVALILVTAGVALVLWLPYWVVASAFGHLWINRRYARAIEEIQRRTTPPGGAA